MVQRVARWLLSIRAAETSDERVFSAAGQTMAPRRTLLEADNLSNLVFINRNYKMPQLTARL